GGRGEILVGGGGKLDVACRGDGTGALELLIERAERRAAIARHVPCRVEAGPAGAPPLPPRPAPPRPEAGDEDAAFPKIVFVVEADRLERHGAFSATRSERLAMP